MRQRTDNMRERLGKLSITDIAHYQKIAERRITELEATRDLSRIWLHVDMDAFYAAVETLSNPSLKGTAMAVGGMSMISTANYEARRYGVRAAMPGFIARKLCPELIFVPVDFEKYTYYSTLTRKVFQRYDLNFISASLDEAYLDIIEVCRERDVRSDEVAEEIRRCVFEETGLTCAGVGPNRLLAKRTSVKSLNSSSLGDVEDLIHSFMIIMLEHVMRQKDGWKVGLLGAVLIYLYSRNIIYKLLQMS
ncbi:DNA polymerase kappa-like [Chenopodium quinoa]|uniref:DNA polymerase kappa-like n=1 Tax=Chenopodium quinoa TaxID=63459 RepID=UPI000B7994E7|nr:DNA polymerase kappa-like [Chenopodium quinoa]